MKLQVVISNYTLFPRILSIRELTFIIPLIIIEDGCPSRLTQAVAVSLPAISVVRAGAGRSPRTLESAGSAVETGVAFTVADVLSGAYLC